MKRIFIGIGLIAAASIGAILIKPQHSVISHHRTAPLNLGSPDISGRLAYIGADGNIYVTTTEGGTPLPLTEDATAPPEGTGLSYPRVSWSPDGRIAYASVTRNGNEAQARLFVADNPGSKGKLVGVSESHFVIYISWSPTPCPERPDCQRLAYLIEEPDGIGLRLIELNPGRTTNVLAGQGWPFYFSWSPDGRNILWHTGGADRFNSFARLAEYSLSSGLITNLEAEPGLFLAPSWSPVANDRLVVSFNGDQDVLQLIPRGFPAQDVRKIASAKDKHIVFEWSPDGRHVAYSIARRSGDLIFGPVYIYEVETGKTKQVTEESFDISGFFWSPDGKRIAYLSRLPLRDAIWMQWRVVNIETGEDRGYAAFNPTYQMRYVISSFNQYAQSHRLWSPDSRYLVYADQDNARIERIWMVDTDAERGAKPIFVAEGTMGFWSWE